MTFVVSSFCSLVAQGVYIYVSHAFCGFEYWHVSVRRSVFVSVLVGYAVRVRGFARAFVCVCMGLHFHF